MLHLSKPTHVVNPKKNFFQKIFNRFYYIPHLPLWFSIFIHECIEGQTNKHFPIKPNNISLPLAFLKMQLTLFIESLWTLKYPILHRHKETFYIFVIIDAFSHFVVTDPSPHISSKYAIQSLRYQ